MPQQRSNVIVALIAAVLSTMNTASSYPEMAGSCGRPSGVHLPNEADTQNGGYTVALSAIEEPGDAASERTATVTLSHRSRLKLEGFLLRAVDSLTLAELGTFTELAPHTQIYQGCTRPAAAVCQLGKQKSGHDSLELPLTLRIRWPTGHALRLMFWAVDDKHRCEYCVGSCGDFPAVANSPPAHQTTWPKSAAATAPTPPCPSSTRGCRSAHARDYRVVLWASLWLDWRWWLCWAQFLRCGSHGSCVVSHGVCLADGCWMFCLESSKVCPVHCGLCWRTTALVARVSASSGLSASGFRASSWRSSLLRVE